MSLLSRHVLRRQPVLYRRLPSIYSPPIIRFNTTIAETISKPISEAPESIQEETIKGTPPLPPFPKHTNSRVSRRKWRRNPLLRQRLPPQNRSLRPPLPPPPSKPPLPHPKTPRLALYPAGLAHCPEDNDAAAQGWGGVFEVWV